MVMEVNVWVAGAMAHISSPSALEDRLRQEGQEFEVSLTA